MTDLTLIGGIILLLTQVVTFAAALLSFVASRRNKAAINEVHLTLNSRLTELLKLTADASRAEGIKHEKDHPS